VTGRAVSTPDSALVDPASATSTDTTLRRDAARNRDRLLMAARGAFDEGGLTVGVEEIAQRAGVGVATLYRRFPTKDTLIQAVMDEVLRAVLDAGQSALENEDPADGLITFIESVGWIQYEHAGCLARLWNNTNPELRCEIEGVARTLLARGQRAGSIRSDLVYEDVTMLFLSMRGVIEASVSVSSSAWLRHQELLICSLTPGHDRLRQPPLSSEQRSAISGVGAMAESMPG
jgi:AcrR family transcriptional regulator